MLAPGQTIDRYELVCPIGEGGMAHVWAARQRGKHGFERLVALKIIHSRYAEDPAFRTMFLDEARIVGSIQHRNVAQVFDLGESGSLLYMAIEFVDGDSLFVLIAPQHTVPLPIALRIAADACAGLHAVHRLIDGHGRPRNVVHRDISPQNLLLSSSGDVKIIDFGIAHARDRAAATTDVGTVKGKVRYMAPEQARRETVGPYTDVFGIGAVLFRTLSGRAPYAAADEIATMQALLANAPAPQALPGDLPLEVVHLVHRAIAPDVRHRFASTAELQAALEDLLTREPRPPDVGAWVDAHLSDHARERRAIILGSAPLPRSPEEDMGRETVRPQRPRTAPLVAQAAPELVMPVQRPARGLTADPIAEPSPGFMDVGALLARAEARPAAQARDVPPDVPLPGAPPQARHYPNVSGRPVAVVGTRGPVSSGRPFKIAIAVIAVVLLVFGVILLLPVFVRDRVIANAKDAGFTLTIDRVGVGFGDIWLRGVTAQPTRFPGMVMKIQELHIIGFSGREVRSSGVETTLEGTLTNVEVDLGSLLADLRVRWAGSTSSPRHVSVVGAKVVWDGLFGPGSRLDASEIGFEMDSRGPGVEESKGSVGKLEIRDPERHFGPWALSLEDTPGSYRRRLILDPAVPDGPSVLVVGGKATATEITVKIARSGFEHLGIKPAELGIPADAATEIEAKIHGRFPATERAELKIEAVLWGARLPGLAGPVDLRVEGGATGSPGKPLDLEKTMVTVGPFTAAMSGTITSHARGLRLDGMFKTLPLTCEKLAKSEAARLGPVTGALQALGQATGVFRVTGNVNVSGIVKYDTAEPSEASLSWIAKETCGVSIFGM